MKKHTKLISLVLSSALAAGTFALACTFSPQRATAITPSPSQTTATEQSSDFAFTMYEGADMRLHETQTDMRQSGLRFAAKLSADDYEKLENECDASYGVLIAPRLYLDEKDFTVETVFADNAHYFWAGKSTTGTRQILNIQYEDLEALNHDEQGNPLNEGFYALSGAIVNIKQTNYETKFVGRAYVKYKEGDDYVYRFADWAGGNMENNSRSIAETALYKYQEGFVKDSAAEIKSEAKRS